MVDDIPVVIRWRDFQELRARMQATVMSAEILDESEAGKIVRRGDLGKVFGISTRPGVTIAP